VRVAFNAVPLPLYAFLLAAGAAISLPIGAVIGTFARPGPTVIAAILSFGAGVLLSAVSFELIEEAFITGGIGAVAISAVVGAGTFIGLNRLLDNLGGFMRKSGTLGSAARRQKEEQASHILGQLSRVDVLRSLPAEDIEPLVPYVQAVSLPSATDVFAEGDAGDALFVVVAGELDVIPGSDGAQVVAHLRPGDTFGETALLTGESRNATVRTTTPVELLRIPRDAFDRLVASSPRLSVAMTQLAADRLSEDERDGAYSPEEARRWRELALRSLRHASLRPTGVEEREVASAAAGSAALGIYLGLVLDGISESIAIGALQTGGVPSLAFLAAVLISNLPESMSSSALMRHLGYGPLRLVLMWGGIVVVSGLAAAFGAIALAGAPGYVLAAIYAFTAGAILAMLAQTAMPEAYEHGGSVVGICTVLGFLSAYYIGTLQTH
jgi:CRP-like cAMP-binding protein